MENFTLGKSIARGAFGTVYKGIFENKPAAIKKIPIVKDTPEYKYLSSEIEILKMLDHKNIVKLFKASSTNNSLYLITELIEGKDLKNYLEVHKFIKKKSAKRIFKQIIEALIYIRDKKIIHRDIKPANILLTSENIEEADIKIIDFGLSTNKISMANTNVGSPLYSAPEVTEYLNYTYKADTWSAGVLFYEAIYGIVPFWAYTVPDLGKLQKRGPNFPHNLNVNESVKELLKAMLAYNPEHRLEYEEILSLKFFQEENVGVETITENKCNYFEIEFEPKKLMIAEYLESINLFDYSKENLMLDDSHCFIEDIEEETKVELNVTFGVTKGEFGEAEEIINIEKLAEDFFEMHIKPKSKYIRVLFDITGELFDRDDKCLCLCVFELFNGEYHDYIKNNEILMLNEEIEQNIRDNLEIGSVESEIMYSEKSQTYNSRLLEYHQKNNDEFENLSKTIRETKKYMKENNYNKQKVKIVLECAHKKYPTEKFFKNLLKEIV